MRTPLVTAVVLVLSLAFGSSASAQADKTTSNDKGGNANKTEMQTIRGVIAGVTAEGETAFDFNANRATTVEAAYLTVVGSPKVDKGDSHDKNAGGNADNKSGSADKKRENVYIVWLSPKTKVDEQSYGPDGKLQTVKDMNFDKVEVGDRVEIQFMCRDESHSNTNTVHSDKAKMKHGRHRTFVGDANWITILPQKHDEHQDTSAKGASKGNSSDASKK